ncbi:hypothetical protein PAXRUDRAFT_152994 [Paxillus rubicundulus Ve08.2h10]|uniref:Uncharacterized protein n=1 Tax=Paxillus rubicundulus Ve08.2h10 TaxID=930991 RepID=A0A0D0DTM2_9AGAM|nr:hypothetical protein PAXRUDRAFT_152994 [Paxillus rubicundulus Ve08.2h10]
MGYNIIYLTHIPSLPFLGQPIIHWPCSMGHPISYEPSSTGPAHHPCSIIYYWPARPL